MSSPRQPGNILRGALIGFGNIALKGHLPAYADPRISSRVRIVAVADPVASTEERVGALLPGARFSTSACDILTRGNIDVADICAPPQAHAEILEICAAEGIHVLCEKPLTARAEGLEDLLATLKRAKIVFMPCHQYRYSPLWTTIADIIASGGIGRTTFAQFNVFRMHADTGSGAWNPAWRTDRSRSGGGILVDTGAHYLYLVLGMFGEPENVVPVLATLKHAEYSVEDTAVVTFGYDRLLVQLNLTWAAHTRENSVWITGTEGSLSYSGSRLLHTRNGRTNEIPMPDISDKQQYVAWYVSLIDEFLRRVANNDTRSDMLEEAAAVMRLLDLTYRRAEQEADAQRP